MLLIDAAEPVTGKIDAERFRLGHILEERTQGVSDHGVQPFQHGLVRFLPVKIVSPDLLSHVS